MSLIPIKVESHSGYKAEEYPKYFYLKGEKYEIIEIIDRWYQTRQNDEWPTADYFKVFTKDNKQFLIKHETENDEWYWVRE